MKPSKKELKKMLKNLSAEQQEKAFKWIDSLSEEEIKKFERRDKVEIVEKLLAKFLGSQDSK